MKCKSKIKKAVAMLFILFFLLNLAKTKNVLAVNNSESLAHLYMVFNKTSYSANEEIDLTINLDQFIDLNEVKIQIKIKKTFFEPIKKDDKYFYFTNASIFQDDVINDFVDEAYLRLRLIKNQLIDDGYYSSYKNNICHLKFIAKTNINNVYEYFTTDNYQEMGISAYLFNTKDEIIKYDVGYSEKMKVSWPVDSYQVDVYGEVPSFKADIVVSNRKENEYEYLVEKQVDTLLIGLKTIHVGIYDKLTADYLIFSKPIEVVDKTPPVIEEIQDIIINDYEIEQLDLLNYIHVHDNYDSFITSNIEYFQSDLQKLSGKSAFEEYLKHNKLGCFKYYATDSSKNTSSTEYIRVQIIDTMSPVIHVLDKIVINDFDVSNFSLEEYFQIVDQYDETPKLIFEFVNIDVENDEKLKEYLNKGVRVKLNYYGIDNSNNATETYQTIIEVIDTTKPVVYASNIMIEDYKFFLNKIDEQVNVIDNFEAQCQLEKKYYIADLEVSANEFEEKVLRGCEGKIKYQAIDSYQNKSDEVFQIIQLIDTTNPVIKVNGIEENKKYPKIASIEFEITDNFDGCSYEIFLDNQPYQEANLSKLTIGSHFLKINAVDSSNNVSSLEISFEIIEDNIMGCVGDIDCYVDNYLEIMIIVITLIVFVITIIVIKIVFYQKSKKQKIK